MQHEPNTKSIIDWATSKSFRKIKTGRAKIGYDVADFTETEETTHFTLKFPSGSIAYGKTSIGKSMHKLYVTYQNGWYTLVG